MQDLFSKKCRVGQHLRFCATGHQALALIIEDCWQKHLRPHFHGPQAWPRLGQHFGPADEREARLPAGHHLGIVLFDGGRIDHGRGVAQVLGVMAETGRIAAERILSSL